MPGSMFNPEKSTQHTGVESKILDKLQKTLGSDEEQIKNCYDIFVESLIEETEILRTSIKVRDLESIRVYAHRNKSSLVLGGLNERGYEAEEIEEMIDSKASNLRILEKAMNHQRRLDEILIELNKK